MIKGSTYNVFIGHLNRCNLTKMDFARILGVSMKTACIYIADPSIIRLKDLYIISGMFGVPLLELIYQVERGRPINKDTMKWYIKGIEEKHKDII